MADMKTHLRELSVAVTIGLLKNGVPFRLADLYDSALFYRYAQSVISNDISGAGNILAEPRYSGENALIIDNGYKLGMAIFHSGKFQIGPGDSILWMGNDTQKGDPIDIWVGQYGFSLKEDSFILRNMGLYELLNCMTGAQYQRGLHVFAHFAPAQYDAWFAYTWEQFVAYLSGRTWSLTKGANHSSAKRNGSNIVLAYNSMVSTVPCNIRTNAQFMHYTSSKTREKVFAKWIHQVIAADPGYLQRKKACAESAGQQVCQYITRHYDSVAVHRFFQIYPNAYYYAKTTSRETTVLKVPGLTDFPGTIVLKACTFSVPDSQLNIISVFENTKTGKTLEFRNECRFSHGQFNGTPEAKMYVRKNTSLTELYEPII